MLSVTLSFSEALLFLGAVRSSGTNCLMKYRHQSPSSIISKECWPPKQCLPGPGGPSSDCHAIGMGVLCPRAMKVHVDVLKVPSFATLLAQRCQ